MMINRKNITITTFIFILNIFTVNTFAQEFQIKKVGADIKFTDVNQAGNVTEPSAVETIGDGKYLLVADDKDKDDGISLKIVEAKTGNVIKSLANITGDKKNPKWEALAKDDDGNYYVIGSHNNSELPKRANRSRLFRFRLKNEAETDPMKFEIDRDWVRELDVKESLKSLNLYSAAAADSPVKIEGLAVQTIGCRKKLFFGFREPFESGNVQVFTSDIPADAEIPNGVIKLLLKPYFQFAAGKPQLLSNTTESFRLSSLEYVKSLKGFLVMTSTEDKDNIFFGNAIWFISDVIINTAQPTTFNGGFKAISLKNIYEFEPKMKAEGISVLPSTGNNKTNLIVVFDNDGKPMLPDVMQILELSLIPQ
jgi:hypothetical protein